MLPYKAPVRFYDFNGIRQIVDEEGREILEVQFTSRDFLYEKNMYEKIAFVIDLMNGKKHIEYNPNTQAHEVFENTLEEKELVSVGSNGNMEQNEEPKKKRGRPKKES